MRSGGSDGGFSTLWITRSRQFRDVFSDYRVLIDGVEWATVGRGQTTWIIFPSGRHRVEAAVDWCHSNPVELDAEPGAFYRMEVGSNVTGWRLLIGLAYVTIWLDRHLYLRAT
jgi:hypothetical protein